jgi:haloalkane dehalogenase
MNVKYRIFLPLLIVFSFAVSVSAQTKILRTPDERFANLYEYNFKPHYTEIEKGLRMHYVEEGKKGAPVVVLLHGQPSWSYLYRKMIPVLAKENRVIAPDMIGYGRSDKLAASADYSYANHVAWMTKFFEKQKLKNATLVVHDWGGLIGLRIVAAHPEWFSRLVVLNTSFNTGIEYEQFTDRYREGMKRWMDHLATAKNIKFAPAVQANVLRTLSPEELSAYDAPYPDDSYTQGARTMTSLIPLRPTDAGVTENLGAEKILREWKKPVFIAFSEDSERVHPKQHQRFTDLFPKNSIWADVSVPGSKHFLQEDKGAEVAAMINDFVAGRKPSPGAQAVIYQPAKMEQNGAAKSGALRPGNPQAHGIKDSDLDALREMLKKGVPAATARRMSPAAEAGQDDARLPGGGAASGASMLIAHKGEIVFQEAYGNLQIDKPAFIASSTKPITATTVLTVVDEGKLNLDDKISKYLPEFKGTKVENATVRQLLSHTSGIKGNYPGGRPKTGTLAEFSRGIAQNGTLVEPGEFNYSGVGMDIAARIAEVATGKTFEELLRIRILEPLGMKNTKFRLAADPASVKPGEGRYISGGGGLDTTLSDIAAFYQMQINGGTYNGKRILSEKMIAEMHRKQSTPTGNANVYGEGYGLGFALNRLDKNSIPQTYGHSGALGTAAWADTDRDLVVIVFTQVQLARAAPLINEVRNKAREMFASKN